MSPRYDAFGRPIEPQDRRASGSSARPRDADRPRATGSQAQDATGRRGPARPDRPDGPDGTGPVRRPAPATMTRSARLWLAFAAVVGTGGVVVALVADGQESSAPPVRVVVPTLPTAPTTAGTTGASIVARDAGAAAVLELRKAMRDDELLLGLLVGPTTAEARMGGRDGRQTTVLLVGADGEVRRSSAGGGATSTFGVPAKGVDPGAPIRLLEAAKGSLPSGTRVQVRAVQATVGTAAGDPLGWVLDLSGVAAPDARWSGDEHGEHVVRLQDGAPARTSGERARVRTPSGLTGRSLLRGTNLRRAIAAVRARAGAGAQLTSVDVTPVRARFGVLAGGRERYLDADAAAGVRGGASVPSTRTGTPLRGFDPDGLERALRGIGARTDTRPGTGLRSATWRPASGPFPALWVLDVPGAGRAGLSWRASGDGRRVGQDGDAGAPGLPGPAGR